MSKTPYTFVTLRYVHDPVTAEFINVGVALYAPKAKFVGALCTGKYSRIGKTFNGIDGEKIRSLLKYIQRRFDDQQGDLVGGVFQEEHSSVLTFARRILPPDDSTLQWSEPGGGFSENPKATLDELYARLVEKYEAKQQPTRDDEEVWKTFKNYFDQENVLSYFQPKKIVSKYYDREFARAWKNRVWHLYEPVSFDLATSGYVVEKATAWVGRATSLKDSPEPFKLHLLLGEPRVEGLKTSFTKAINILKQMPGESEIVREKDAASFSHTLAKEMRQHGT
jgi:hypothetical protein